MDDTPLSRREPTFSLSRQGIDRKFVRRMWGTINATEFRGYQPGTLIVLPEIQGDWTITKFLHDPDCGWGSTKCPVDFNSEDFGTPDAVPLRSKKRDGTSQE